MKVTVFLTLFCLLNAAFGSSKFPTNIADIEQLETAILPKSASVHKFDKKDLDDPEKLTKLADELEKLAGGQSPLETKKEKRRRKLFMDKVLKPINDKTEIVGNLAKPIGKFLGVDYDDRRDSVNSGLGLTMAGLGYMNMKNRASAFQRIYGILEHKYHLNNLFLDSIQKQNSNAEYSGKTLHRIFSKVAKTRKAVLAKIHATINPLS